MAKNAKLSKTVLSFNRALVSLLCVILIISSTLYCSSSPSSTYQESFKGQETLVTVGWIILIVCGNILRWWLMSPPTYYNNYRSRPQPPPDSTSTDPGDSIDHVEE